MDGLNVTVVTHGHGIESIAKRSYALCWRYIAQLNVIPKIVADLATNIPVLQIAFWCLREGQNGELSAAG